MSKSPLYSFFAMVSSTKREHNIRRINVNHTLQMEMSTLFTQQEEAFLEGPPEEIHFGPTYTVSDHEVFVISDFDLPVDLIQAARSPHEHEAVDNGCLQSIKCIIAAGHEGQGDGGLTLLFQPFTKRQVLGRHMLSFLHSARTFTRLDTDGITLGTSLAAVFREGKLYFRSFSTVSRFLDLKSYFTEATNHQIDELFEHERMVAEDLERTKEHADSWMRKRFSALIASGILDKVTPRKALNVGKRYDCEFEIQRKYGKEAFVFPADKKRARQLLDLLNESYFDGPLTQQPYHANSQRPVPTSSANSTPQAET
jgi:hypothetical protein